MIFCGLIVLVSLVTPTNSVRVIDSQVSNVLQEWHGVGLTAWSVDSRANVCTLGVTGERIYGSGEPLQTTGDSRHHIGSVTKSITASLLAILMEQGHLPEDGWNTTVPQVIPEAAGGPYENVTLRELTGSISGMHNLPPDDTEFPPFDSFDLRSFRHAVATAAVTYPPAVPPGTTYLYSNWAWVTAGYIIENVTDMVWEEAVATLLFEPLGIDLGDDRSQFVGAPNNERDPWGHMNYTPCDPSASECDNPAVLGPAGTFSGPVAAMASYFAWHLACHNGEHSTLLSQAACRELHQPADPIVSDNYGYGWVCYDHPQEGLVCTHNGSNTLNYYNATLVFGRNRAFTGYTNAGYTNADLQNVYMVNEMVESVLRIETENCTTPFESSFYINQPTMAPTSSPTGMPTASLDEDTSAAGRVLLAGGSVFLIAACLLIV